MQFHSVVRRRSQKIKVVFHNRERNSSKKNLNLIVLFKLYPMLRLRPENQVHNWLYGSQNTYLLKYLKSQLQLAIFILLFSLSFLNINAQAIIKGTIGDSINLTHLPFSTIIVRHQFETDKIFLSSSANELGEFKITVDTGHYVLSISFVGYLNKEIIVWVNQTREIDLGTVHMIPGHGQLREVTVESKKPVYRFSPGKIIYDVQNDPRALGKNGLEVLRQAPLVSINGFGSIQLKGRSTFLLQMNGKTFMALSGNPTDFLQSLDQNQIEKIEIITNPSAKYSAEGITGIINIVTKKNRDMKNFGSVNLGYDTYNNSLFGLNFSGKKRKFGYTLIASENLWRNGKYEYSLHQQIAAKTIVVNGQTFPKRNNFYGIGSLSFQPDKNNIFNLDINIFAGKGDINNSFFNNTEIVRTTNRLKNNNISIGTDFEHKIDSITSFVFSYKYENQKNNSIIHYSDSFSSSANKGLSSENTFQIDFKRKNLEWGSKAILRSLHSDIVQNNPQAGAFIFRQNVYAAYISYNKTFHEYNVEAGLRGEYTDYYGSKNKDLIFYLDKYTKLFPILSIDRSFAKSKTNISFAYSKRILRPQLYYLNPFINSTNPYSFIRGNSILKPELSDNFELRIVKQDKKSNYHIFAFSYQYGRNNIINFLYPINDSVITSTYANFKYQHLAGLSLNSSFSLFKKIQVNLSDNVYWTFYPKSLPTGLDTLGYRIGNNGFFGSLGLTLSGTLFKKIRWVCFNSYNLPEIYIQGKGSSFFYQDITFTSFFLKNKLLVFASVRQPLINKYDYQTTNADLGFIQIANNTTPQRRLFIGLRYSFGKPTAANVRTRKNIDNKDKKNKNTLDNIK